MRTNSQKVLALLRQELAFLDGGGYKRNSHSAWRPPYLFEESPSCPNFSDRSRSHACTDCWLIQYVSPELRDEQIPCRFVQLEDGVTVDSLYRHGTQAEAEQSLRHWLRNQIHELESELSEVEAWVPAENSRPA
jgi:hypothetical protein